MPPARFQNPFSSRQAAWVLLGGAFMSVFIWALAARFMAQSARQEFEREAAIAAGLVERRFSRYTDLLQGMAGLFGAHDQVSRLDFHKYVNALDLPSRFPGVQSMQYVERVPFGLRREFERRIQQDTSVVDTGYPQFAIHPAGRSSGDSWVINYVEPLSGNEAAFGLDILSREGAREAAMRARNTGEPAITGKYRLVQDTVDRVGLVVYLPLFKGSPHAAERASRHVGFVTVVFRPDDVFSTVLDPDMRDDLYFIIRDLGLADEPLATPGQDNIILTQGPGATPGPASLLENQPVFMRKTSIAGRTWEITVGMRSPVLTAWLHPFSLASLIAALTIFVLLALVVHKEAHARTEATLLADRATLELRQQLSFNQQLIEALPNPVYFKDAAGRYLGCNKAFEDFTGHRKDELVGKTADEMQTPEAAQLYSESDEALLESPGTQRYESHVQFPGNAETHHVQYNKATFSDAQGKVAGMVGVMVDLTDIKRAEQNLRRNEAQLRLALESADMATWHWNAGEKTFQASSGFNPLFGLKRSSVVSKFEDFRAAIHPEDQAQVDAVLRHSIVYSDDFQLEMRVVWPDGSIHWIASQGQVIRNQEGRAVSLMGVAMNITERKLAEERIAHMAQHDALTGLPNRLLLKDRISQAVFNAHRSRGKVAVLFIDLDRFKNINDSLGHEAGDRLLQTVAKRIKTCLREGDTVSRQGGDEFVIVLPEVQGAHDVAVVAAKVLETLSQPYHLNGQDLHISASIGTALFPEDGEDADTLMRNADAAMYHAKDTGRANYQFFTEHMNLSAQKRVTLEAELRRGMDRGELIMYYQPMFDLGHGRMVGTEALLRWRHPERGLVSPAEFISVAEDSGLIHAMGEQALRAACVQARLWQDQGFSLWVSVNVSVQQLRRRAFVEQLRNILSATRVHPGLLELEITESLIVEDSSEALRTLRALDDLGVRLAIDDFGTGYSGLSYLKRFPIDTVKIDQSFIRDISVDADDAAIVRAIVGMAKSLKLSVVAEGVETGEQLAFLSSLGCDYAQGYLLGYPVPANELSDLLDSQRAPAG